MCKSYAVCNVIADYMKHEILQCRAEIDPQDFLLVELAGARASVSVIIGQFVLDGRSSAYIMLNPSASESISTIVWMVTPRAYWSKTHKSRIRRHAAVWCL